jgi:thiol-disulfide isomerase/thioredoxin
MASKAPTTKWLAIGLALVLAWALFLATAGRVIGVGDLKPPDLNSSPTILTDSADFDWTLQDLQGHDVKLSDFKGRPILLNLWATTCPPCIEEMPSLAKLADHPTIKKKGLAILCISTDETLAKVQDYMKDRAWKVTILYANTLPIAFQADAIPTTFLIGTDGRIVTTQIGAALWDDPSVIEFISNMK